MKKIGGFVFLLVCFQTFFGQDKSVRYKTSAIVSVGTNMYFGDLSEGSANLGYGVSVSSRFRLTNKTLFRPEFDFQHLQSQVFETNGLSFKNNLKGAVLNFEIGMHKLSRGKVGRMDNELYLLIAPLIYHHSPYAMLDGQKTFLAPLQTEDEVYSKFIPGAKIGFNFNSLIRKESRFGLQLDYTLLLSDYVDDVSGNYINYKVLDENRQRAIDPTGIAEIDTPRGNKSKLDGFLKLTLLLELSFEKSKKEF